MVWLPLVTIVGERPALLGSGLYTTSSSSLIAIASDWYQIIGPDNDALHSLIFVTNVCDISFLNGLRELMACSFTHLSHRVKEVLVADSYRSQKRWKFWKSAISSIVMEISLRAVITT